jgi:hypothetical protein
MSIRKSRFSRDRPACSTPLAPNQIKKIESVPDAGFFIDRGWKNLTPRYQQEEISTKDERSLLASSMNLNRIYFKTFQIFVQPPIHPLSILTGEVLAGVIKGLFASSLIIAVGLAISPAFHLTPIFLLVLLLNCFLFAGLGVIARMVSKSHEDTATYSNLFIMPMAFFGGTFFPLNGFRNS